MCESDPLAEVTAAENESVGAYLRSLANNCKLNKDRSCLIGIGLVYEIHRHILYQKNRIATLTEMLTDCGLPVPPQESPDFSRDPKASVAFSRPNRVQMEASANKIMLDKIRSLQLRIRDMEDRIKYMEDQLTWQSFKIPDDQLEIMRATRLGKKYLSAIQDAIDRLRAATEDEEPKTETPE